MKFCPRCPADRQFPVSEVRCPDHGVRLSLRDPYRLVGTLINGKYQLEALLGIGGMGAVYLATHVGINRQVAFKALKPDLAASDPTILESFRREATISGGLFHPNIVNVTDADVTADGIAYMVMELLECPTLEEELARTPVFTVQRTGRLIEQICGALQVAHSRQIVHRDLKPANIAVLQAADGSEFVKILDFGIAKSLSEGVGKVSQAMGTPIYASPEQFSPGMPIDGRSDIYSLSVIIFQMLTGTVPFRGKTVGEIVRHHLATPPPELRRFRPEIPIEIERVVLRGLGKKLEERPTSAADFLALFQAAIVQAGVQLSEEGTGFSAPKPLIPSPTVSGGVVTIALTGAPVGADVIVNDWPRGKTDGSGQFVVTDLTAGNHVVKVKKSGYEPWSLSFTCQPGERKQLVVMMNQSELARTVAPGQVIDSAEAQTLKAGKGATAGLSTSAGQTLYTPPPVSYSPPRVYAAPRVERKSSTPVVLLVVVVLTVGLGGLVLATKFRSNRSAETPPPVTQSPPAGKDPAVPPEYRGILDDTALAVSQAVAAIPTSIDSSPESVEAVRGKIDSAQARIANAVNRFGKADPGRLRSPHDTLKDRYADLLDSLDRYNRSLRGYADALRNTEYVNGQPVNGGGATERAQAERDREAFQSVYQDVRALEAKLAEEAK